jgi:predicted hotdog family 3-hydroxylacyl-ACP dehydratase
MSAALPPITDVVPHRAPSLLIDELVEADAHHALARLRITERSLFFDNEGGGVPALVAIEYMAQTVAAYAGSQRRAQNEPTRLGFLLSCRKLTLEVDAFRPGDELVVEAKHIWSSPPLGQFECSVRRGDQTIANATLSVYEGSLEGALNP